MVSTNQQPAWIEGIATHQPERQIEQDHVHEVMSRWLDGLPPEDRPYSPDEFDSLFDNAGVETRHSIVPVERVLKPIDFGQQSDLYLEHAPQMAVSIVKQALDHAKSTAGDIDMIITVSCTGFTVPALDSYVLNKLDFRHDVRRLPIAELGCSAGANAIGRAVDFLKAHPDSRVLVLSVELCSINFQPGDPSRAQAISAALFGDGAAGVVLAGPEAPNHRNSGPAVLNSKSHFFENTLEYMGYRNTARGTSIVLSPRIPAAVREHSAPIVGTFLEDNGARTSELSEWVVHPGGPAIMEAFEQSMDSLQRLHASRRVLKKFGNLSSATVLHVLDDVMDTDPSTGATGLMLAFGPGFNAEMSLLQWL